MLTTEDDADDLYPCDTVPTAYLRIRKRRITTPTLPSPSSINNNNNNNIIIYTPLPPASGLAILRYVYDALSISDDIPQYRNAVDLPSDSFFGIGPSTNNNNNTPPVMMSLIEKARFLNTLYPCVENIPRITRQFLIRHNITLSCLLQVCGVPIIDLRSAGICTTLDDLCELGFQITDLTNQTGNTRLFNVNHMMQLFKVGAPELASHPVIAFDVRHLIAARFAPAELEALGVSVPGMIEKKQIALRHLAQLGYAPRDLYTLGVRRLHLSALGIGTPGLAAAQMRWSATEFSVFQ